MYVRSSTDHNKSKKTQYHFQKIFFRELQTALNLCLFMRHIVSDRINKWCCETGYYINLYAVIHIARL